MSKPDELKNKKKKIGFTMYPKDWWSSGTFFDVDDMLLRYFYIEMMFMIYSESGFWMEDRLHFSKRLRHQLTDHEWGSLKALYRVETFADGNTYWHHDGISERLGISPRQIVANRTNGVAKSNPNTGQYQAINNPNDTHFDSLRIELNRKELNQTELKAHKGPDSSVIGDLSTYAHRSALLGGLLCEKLGLTNEELEGDMREEGVTLESLAREEGFEIRHKRLQSAPKELARSIAGQSYQKLFERIEHGKPKEK